MITDQIVTGQRYSWNLVKKLGEGDAGEVYLVESLLEGIPAILKRPRKSAFFSDVLRQAGQIMTEGNILRTLSGVSFPSQSVHLSVPGLLDQSPSDTGFSERYFIVIEQAHGLDLKSLRQIILFGLTSDLRIPSLAENLYFVKTWSQFREIPGAFLIRILLGVVELLETIHNTEFWNERVKQTGVIWNDVKPEHLYWDPVRTCLTVIDWGNSQYLEIDGNTKDRQYSQLDDFKQFLQEMGGFVGEANPELFSRLGWPQKLAPGDIYLEGVKPLKERLASYHESLEAELETLRKQRADLYAITRPGLDHLAQSEIILKQFVTFGEIPEISGATNFHARAALLMASENRLEEFQQVCASAMNLPDSTTAKWELLQEFARLAIERIAGLDNNQTGEMTAVYANALAAGVVDDWPKMLWELFTRISQGPLPDWWGPLSQSVQRIHLGLDQETVSPYIMVSRLFFTLRAAILQKRDIRLSSKAEGHEAQAEMLASDDLLRTFNDEVVKKWREIEPAPPDSGIAYTDIETIADHIDSILPGSRDKLVKVLAQPNAQVGIVLSAWDRKDFDLARKGLHTILVWDPDRYRLLTADRAIELAPQWLARVRKGAGKDEPFYDYLTSVELIGRRLRNQVGPATWLDTILDAFKRLRKGTRIADLIITNPEILQEIPWLNEYRSREILSLPRTRNLTVEREQTPLRIAKLVTGVVDGRLGRDQDLALMEPLDTWLPEARGSSARVFTGLLRNQTGQSMPYAIKIMRPDQVEYALPLFREEIQILTLLRDVPGITPMVECGFMRFEAGLIFPSDESQTAATNLMGQLVRYGVDEAQNYLASIDRYLADGWIPYLALMKRSQEYNLMRYCDAGYTHGWLLPLSEGLILTIQICEMLQIAHDRNIIYRDHKILHYYWDPDTHGVAMIDWNIAKRQPQGLSDVERQFDLVQLGARALHHILTGRPAQGSLPLGPNRPEDIERASARYPVNWTYDDERLPNRIKEILEQLLNQGYTHVRDLRQDLVDIYQQVSNTTPPIVNGH